MDMDRPIKVNRGRKYNNIYPFLGMMAFAIAVSLVIAFIWQNMGGDSHNPSAYTPISSSSTPESTPAPTPTPTPEPTPTPTPVIEGALPESERVTSDYFSDAAFVGDSITTGIELYGVMSNTTVLAETGLNLDTIYTKGVVKQEDGTRISVMDALKQTPFQKIYIQMGGNEIRDEELEVFGKRYRSFLDDVKQYQPNAIIYVQSIFPVTAHNNYNMDNKKIDAANDLLMEICKEKQVYYLYVAECLKDENGMLPDEASPNDGMHFGREYYDKWFEYLKTHVAP